MTIYLCSNSLEGILSGVYDAYAGRLGHENVKLQIADGADLELFADYRETEADPVKAEKVLRTVRREMGQEAYECICQAAESFDGRKADVIYRTIVLGLKLPKNQQVMHCLTKDYVCTVAQLAKKTWNEAHRLMGFVRFTELSGNILYAEIHPENNVLPFLAPHFADRFPEENWVIYDEGRSLFAVHQAKKGWILVEGAKASAQISEKRSAQEDDYRQMWKAFLQSLTIGARKNEELQKQLLPLKFRDKMSEFEDVQKVFVPRENSEERSLESS